MADPSNPIPGFYKTRMVKKGPWIAARIECHKRADRSDIWAATINGEPAGDAGPNHLQNEHIGRIMLFGEPISEATYNFMIDAAKWDKANDPDSPGANPRRAIDFNDLPPEF